MNGVSRGLVAAERPSLGQGRLYLGLAAVLWSLSGAFVKLLTRDSPLHLNLPEIHPLSIAFFRVLFAGLILAPTLRRCDVSFRGLMIAMVGCFTVMNALFVFALSRGTAANAILLEYSAPMWMYLASIWWLGEAAERRSSIALAIGLAGIAIIILGGWRDARLSLVAVGLGCGVAYAGVLLCLRVLRGASPRWLTVLNHLAAALALVPWLFFTERPTLAQLGFLVIFGSIQMALPYWLAARALQTVSPQEAGTITLLEPLLNPLWAYLVASEAPSPFTLVGGAFILGALTWRYWPLREKREARSEK